MITYSVSVHRVNTEGGGSAKRYYASTQSVATCSFGRFCQHIADHGSMYRKSDVMGVLGVMVGCLRELLLEGKRVEVGDLGYFKVKAHSVGSERFGDVSASSFTKVSVRWTPGEGFANMISDARLKRVLSRTQTRTLAKAVAAGKTQVELTG